MIILWIYLAGLFLALVWAGKETYEDYINCGWGGYTLESLKIYTLAAIIWPLSLIAWFVFSLR
jgi:hypothetical protein